MNECVCVRARVIFICTQHTHTHTHTHTHAHQSLAYGKNYDVTFTVSEIQCPVRYFLNGQLIYTDETEVCVQACVCVCASMRVCVCVCVRVCVFVCTVFTYPYECVHSYVCVMCVCVVNTQVGHRLSTKAVGSTGRVDITKLYKTVETPTGLRFNAVSSSSSTSSSFRGPR
jgi:hypothetical protein